jgi:Replication-relaxation
MTNRGGDEALIEWRSATACAYGRFRPDGYGCYRRGARLFGFFLEYDRGTERLSQYVAKLASYYRYRDTGAFKHDYQSFPTVLVVTTSADAEARLAYQVYLAQLRHAGAPLLVFLTTTCLIRACVGGVLGPVWRSASASWSHEAVRVCWLPQPGRHNLRDRVH